MRIAPVLVAVALLAGCGADDEEPATPTPPPPPARDVVLDVRFDDGEGETREGALRCGGGTPEATGYLEGEEASELCRSALALASLLTEEPPERACTQIFGGPQSAQFTGELDGEPVDRGFSRENGCRIAEWDRLARAGLLPAA